MEIKKLKNKEVIMDKRIKLIIEEIDTDGWTDVVSNYKVTSLLIIIILNERG